MEQPSPAPSAEKASASEARDQPARTASSTRRSALGSYIGAVLFLVTIFVALYVSTKFINWEETLNSVTAPAFASEAKSILQNSLAETTCSYREVDSRHFILCRNISDKARKGQMSAWESSGGLWEVEHAMKASEFRAKDLKNMPDYRLRPVDGRARQLKSYLRSDVSLGNSAGSVNVKKVMERFQ